MMAMTTTMVALNGREAAPAEVRRRMFDVYVVPHLPLVRRIVTSMTVRGETVDDNLQDVLVHLFQHIDRFDASAGRWALWLETVVRNKMQSIHRHTMVEDPYWADDDALLSDVSGEGDEDRSRVVPHCLVVEPRYGDGADCEVGERTRLPAPPLTLCREDYPSSYDALMALPPLQRRVLLFAAEGWSPADIAEELRMTPGAVSSALWRGRSFLSARVCGS